MRILVWGINYHPEPIGIAPCNTALCEFLAGCGHAVAMVTGFPYYPAWKKAPGNRLRLFESSTRSGVAVHRCWLYVPRKVTPLRRMAHEASFVLFSLLRVLTLPSPDVVVVVSPPLLLGVAVRLAALFKRAPYVFHVQDLQPDAALSLSMLRPSRFTRLLFAIERAAYAGAARVSAISQAMLDALAAKGVPPGRLVLFPNSTALPGQGELPDAGRFRRRHGFRDTDFLVVYSGNLGVKQGLELVVDAVPLLENGRVRVVICGDGAGRERLAALVRTRGLHALTLLPLQEPEAFREMLTDADLCLVVQRAGTARWFLPSKLLTLFAHGKPVLTVSDADSDMARAMDSGGLGINVPPGNPLLLARTIERLANQPERLAAFANAGRRYVEQFSADRVLPRFEAVLCDIVARRAEDAGETVSSGAERAE